MPILQGRPGSHPKSNYMIGKQTVNTTLTKGHQTKPAHCQKFSKFSHNCSPPNIFIHYYYCAWGRQIQPGSFPSDTPPPVVATCVIYCQGFRNGLKQSTTISPLTVEKAREQIRSSVGHSTCSTLFGTEPGGTGMWTGASPNCRQHNVGLFFCLQVLWGVSPQSDFLCKLYKMYIGMSFSDILY